MDARDVTEEWKQQFEIPKPKKSKGRYSGPESLGGPLAIFHDLNQCQKKGPNGSPTYDDAGFELDWRKVNDRMKPQRYNKNAIVNGMERMLARVQTEEEQIFEVFFVKGKAPYGALNYVKDQNVEGSRDPMAPNRCPTSSTVESERIPEAGGGRVVARAHGRRAEKDVEDACGLRVQEESVTAGTG